MKKRLLKNLMLVMVMTILCFAVAMTASAETYTGECGLEGDNLTWTFDTETGVLTIDGKGEMDNYALYNNINKTSAPWWDYYSSMTELVIGNEVASIGDYAFYNCDTLTSIEIPENIETIGDYAFYDCNNIVDVNFKEGLVSIGAYTFYQCDNIKEVIIPDSVTEIGTYSFDYCENIENIKVGNGLIKIPSQAFAHCKKLNNIEWGTNLKTISSFAFAYCHQNGGEVGYNCGSIVIPCGVERIDRHAFYISESRKNTSSVSIPLSVKYIGEDAFGSHGGEIINVYYEGTIEQWEEIDIYSYSNSNENLRNATIHLGHAHSYTSEITTEPTCFTTGVKTYTCECGETYTRTLSALGHDIVIDSAVSATCTETGLTEGEHCLRCEYKVEQTETPSLGHDEKVIPAVAATCYETGLTEGLVCSKCDAIFTAQEITPTIDHSIISYPAIAPTCTETGLTAGEGCSECSYMVNQEIVPALGHTEVTDEAVAPTCTKTGLTEGKHCNVCGEPTVAQEVIPALGHKEVFTTYVEPTCTEDGLSVGKVCETCKEVFIPAQVIPAKGHRLSNWIVTSEATCEANGKKIKICACGLVEEEIIEAIGHTDSDDNGKCDTCSASLREETEQPKQESNVFSFLTEFLNNLLDFFRKLFGIK